MTSPVQAFHGTSTFSLRGMGGYALIAALIVLVIASLAVGLAVDRAGVVAQRERETHLLFVGNVYRHAIADYFTHPPLGQAPSYPPRLEDLLEDPRTPAKARWLRALYSDPITGRNDWQLERVGGRIVGLHSASADAPLRHSGFDAIDAAFADAKTYRDWRFSAASLPRSAFLPFVPGASASSTSAADPVPPPPAGPAGGGGTPLRPIFANPAKNCAVLYGVPPNNCSRIPPPMGHDQATCQALFQQLLTQCLASIANAQ